MIRCVSVGRASSHCYLLFNFGQIHYISLDDLEYNCRIHTLLGDYEFRVIDCIRSSNAGNQKHGASVYKQFIDPPSLFFQHFYFCVKLYDCKSRNCCFQDKRFSLNFIVINSLRVNHSFAIRFQAVNLHNLCQKPIIFFIAMIETIVVRILCRY